MPFLQAIDGPHPGKRYPLDKPESIMGRHPNCDIVIDVGAVSRHHAKVIAEGGDFLIEDLGSRNGTYVNESKVTGRLKLGSGDNVRVCDVSLTFYDDRPFPAPGSVKDETSHGTTMLVDDGSGGSNIMSTLDVSSTSGPARLSSSTEAKLSALIEITRHLGRALSLDEVLPQVISSLFKIFVQADRGFIVLREEDGRLVPRWTQVRRGDDETIRISRTVINQVIDSQEAILSADAASDARFELSESIADFRIRSMMCVPLIDSEGNAFGALQIDTLDQRNRFEDDDLDVLVAVASQAAVAIDNARLHDWSLRQRALERDLEVAHEVQHSFLPREAPHVEGFCFFNYYQPANFVGGDYYDYIQLHDGRVAVVVADVVGHGIAAALLMAKLSADVRFSLANDRDPAVAMTKVNAAFARSGLDDKFVTGLFTVIDPASEEVTVVNAGHMSPLLRRPDGTVEELDDRASLPLGVLETTEYESRTFKIQPGEVLAFYTDGINEAMNHEGEMYSIDRVRQQLARNTQAVEQVGQAVINDVVQFLSGQTQEDDMCLVCVGRVEKR